MKEITGKIKKKKKSTSRKALKIIKMSLYFLEQISNECNSFFTNEGPTLAGNIQPVSTGYTEYLMFFNDAISSSNLTTEKLEITLKPLKRNMAAG